MLHRDLKLSNIYLSKKMEVKIGDFSQAARLSSEGERRHSICGSSNYIAPDVLDGKKGHSYEVDVWYLGVIAYTLLFGKHPFETPDIKSSY